MGACDFSQFGRGKSAIQAFKAAVEQAEWDHGHAGYTGTIAEKGEIVVIKDTPAQVIARVNQAGGKKAYPSSLRQLESTNPRVVAEGMAEVLMALDDERIYDKWGPAGCIVVKEPTGDEEGEYLFFGWASS